MSFNLHFLCQVYIYIYAFHSWWLFIFHTYLNGFVHYNVFLMWTWRCLSYAVYNFSCIRIYKKPHNGLQLELTHVAMNKLIKLALCVTDFSTYACERSAGYKRYTAVTCLTQPPSFGFASCLYMSFCREFTSVWFVFVHIS